MSHSDDERVSARDPRQAIDPIANDPARPAADPDGDRSERPAAQPAGQIGVPEPKPGQTRWLVIAVGAVIVLLLLFALL
jgi:hypothetical protein